MWDYSQEHLFVIRDENVSHFVKFEIILPLLFIRPPYKYPLQNAEFCDTIPEPIKSNESCCQQSKGLIIT